LEFKYNCWSKNCGKTIKPIDWKDWKDWKNKNLQKNYGKHFSSFVKSKSKI